MIKLKNIKMKMSMKVDLEQYSKENLEGMGRFLQILINHMELVNIDRTTTIVKIPNKTLERKNLSYEESKSLITGINKISGNTIIALESEKIKSIARQMEPLHRNDDSWVLNLHITPPDENLTSYERALNECLLPYSLTREEFEQSTIIKFENINTRIALKELNNLIGLELEKDDSRVGSKIKFDTLNSTLSFGKIRPHSFHKGKSGNVVFLIFFKKLWEERKHIQKGKLIKEGMAFPPDALARQLETSNEKIYSMAKNIGKIAKNGFPIKIERKNGIQLIVTEQ